MRAPLAPGAKTEFGPAKPGLPEFGQQFIGMAAQKVQRVGAFGHKMHPNLITMLVQFKSQPPQFLGVERDINDPFRFKGYLRNHLLRYAGRNRSGDGAARHCRGNEHVSAGRHSAGVSSKGRCVRPVRHSGIIRY